MKLNSQYARDLFDVISKGQMMVADLNEVAPTEEVIYETGILIAAIGASFAALRQQKTKEEILKDLSDLLDESGKIKRLF